jgi:WD40 repeat protein
MFKYDSLELARIIGEPKDPRRPYPLLVDALCEVDSADPEEYVYYFDVLQDTDKIFTITADGSVTTTNVTPDTPALLSFVDVATDEYYVKVIDLAKAKERVLGRKKITINRALNAEENYQVVTLLNAAAVAEGNLNDLRSGETSFNYQHLIDMIDQVIDYSENYVLTAGTQIDKDIKLWNWKDNKFQDLQIAFDNLGISVKRINQTVTRDNVSTPVLASTVAYLAGTTTEAGKPFLFVRKRMNEIEKLNGIISESGDQAERLVFVSPNPVQVSSTRYLAVGITGYEEFAVATTNPKAISKFTRTV